MKVNNRKGRKPFGDLILGNVFLYEEEVFMVIQAIKSNELEGQYYNAVKLSNDEGWLLSFDVETEVIPVEAELTIF